MKVAVVAQLAAKRDVEVDSGHGTGGGYVVVVGYATIGRLPKGRSLGRANKTNILSCMQKSS